jgi:hypothetical protein
MNTTNRVLLFFVLPILSIFFFPPAMLLPGLSVIAVVVIILIGLGVWLWRGHSQALTLTIFLQGFNVIIRLMMLFPHTKTNQGEFDLVFIFTSLVSMAVSTYLLLRLDRADIRSQLID